VRAIPCPLRPRLGRARRVISAALVAASLVELAPAATARADGAETSVQAVERLTNQAYELTAAGKYSEAIGAYMKAYEISKVGAVLFNIATIYDRKLHERALAMEYFRRYLQATDADPEFARKATERLSALKADDAADAKARSAAPVLPTPAPAPATQAESTAPPRASSDGSGLRRGGVVVGIVGLAGVGAALGVGILAKSKADDANHYCDATSCSTSQGVTLEHQAGDLATASTAIFVGGAALLVMGVTLFLVAPRGGSASSASVAISPRVSASGGGVTLEASF
jgi:tetratricopeptide (TPR) repeat protein